MRHVALLRGINVGKAKRISMADLKALVEGLGYGGVRTLLNSGNVVFDAGKAGGDHAARIEKAVASTTGIASRVTTLSAPELAAIVEGNPIAAGPKEPSRYLVAVLYDPKDAAKLKPVAAKGWAPEKLAVGRRWAYVWCANGILESTVLAELGRALKDGVTTRNWATIEKLHAMVEGP